MYIVIHEHQIDQYLKGTFKGKESINSYRRILEEDIFYVNNYGMFHTIKGTFYINATRIYKRMAPSTSSVTPSTSITMALEKIPSTLSRIFARTTLMAHSTHQYHHNLRLLTWAQSTSMLVSAPGLEKHKRFLEFGHSSARIAAPYRLLKWAHSTSRIAAPDKHETWSLQEDILKPFETILNRSYTDLKQEPMIYTYKGKTGLYKCRALPLSQLYRGPKENQGKSIHIMLKDGIDTWAPKLPVERVIVDYLSLDEEMHEESFQQHAIRCTLMRILEYSKVDATIGHHMCDTDPRTRFEILLPEPPVLLESNISYKFA
uniref:Arginine--tRNA ligase, chloroplastic/mitochondrial n=1 Tax=Tanacetum cinerariifolium TaxID=118510 RepID=A0A6L2KS88_TANCI|nr:arginine--tRNA ligase, chloroplastic/mitochondrial [Tanacetum cinerariifolium]